MSISPSSRLARRWRRPVGSSQAARPARAMHAAAARPGRRGHGSGGGGELLAEARELLAVRPPGPAGGLDLELLALVDPASLPDDAARLDYVAACDQVDAHAAWLRARALVAVAGERPSGSLMSEVALEHEVAIARGTSTSAAGRAIENARLLAGPFAGFAAALRVGLVREAHVNVLVERTRNVVHDGVLAAVADRVLPHATRLTPGAFGKQVARAVADLDPDASGRHRRAKARRRVWTAPAGDGMGFLGVVDDQATIAAIAATLDADAAVLKAARGGAAAVAAGVEDARLDPCRADALAARILGTVVEDGHGKATVTFTREPVPVVLHLVMDLATLRGEADRMGMLEGTPVPAGIAREHAEGAVAWRRMVTDPVDGHLLDYGTTSYLPAPLRRYVLARDGGCRSPICTLTSPARLQLDHATPYPAGPSTTGNTGAICAVEHQLKTAGHLTITDSRPDGSATWTTALGQTRHLPPRPFLHDPHDTGPPDTPPF